MDVYDTILAIIDSHDQEINGRTAIHKLAYFADQIIPEIDIPPHKAHFYGPFNEEIAISLEKLVSFSFLEERKIPGYMYDSYLYRLTPDGNDMVKKIKKENKESYTKIKEIVDICDKFCQLKSGPLSYAAKIYYMLTARPKGKQQMTYDEAIIEGRKLDWRLSEDDTEQGVKLLEKLHLVKSISK